MAKKLTIGIDFDNTWTADPDLWLEFCMKAKQFGHTIIIATGRDKYAADIARYYLSEDLPIVFCGNQYKDIACQKAGYKVDIWIDDSPETIREQLLLNLDD